jgi:hypothetical protein
MACFEVDILYTPVVNELHLQLSTANITTDYSGNIVSDVETSVHLTEFNISVVCDIDYGVPLYATDGSVYTIDGVPVYVRRAKVSDYT